MSTLNTELGTSIMLVTHDPSIASFCRRILFVQDGRIFTGLYRGDLRREQFFIEIIQVVSTMGRTR